MKVKLSEFFQREAIKNWIIIILVLTLITLIGYRYVYPWIYGKAYDQAFEVVIKRMLYQIQETGKVKIKLNENYFVLIPEALCNETDK